jgi:hypothetical protein
LFAGLLASADQQPKGPVTGHLNERVLVSSVFKQILRYFQKLKLLMLAFYVTLEI